MEEEEDLQVVSTCFSLGGMAPYSYSASVLSVWDQSWEPFLPPRLMYQQCTLLPGQEFVHTNARPPFLRPPIQGLFILQI